MNNWKKLLCKNSISEYLIDEIEKNWQGKVNKTILESFSEKIEEKRDLSELKKSIDRVDEFISKELKRQLLSEYKEIKMDLKWIGSDRGKYIIEFNEWFQEFHTEFSTIKKFENIMIGGHSEKKVIFITGKLNSEKNYENLLEYIKEKKPPFKLLMEIKIE